MTSDTPVRLLPPHLQPVKILLLSFEGPVIYTAESVDNETLEIKHPHFEGIGIKSNTQLTGTALEIEGIPGINLSTKGGDCVPLGANLIPMRRIGS